MESDSGILLSIPKISFPRTFRTQNVFATKNQKIVTQKEQNISKSSIFKKKKKNVSPLALASPLAY